MKRRNRETYYFLLSFIRFFPTTATTQSLRMSNFTRLLSIKLFDYSVFLFLINDIRFAQEFLCIAVVCFHYRKLLERQIYNLTECNTCKNICFTRNSVYLAICLLKFPTVDSQNLCSAIRRSITLEIQLTIVHDNSACSFVCKGCKVACFYTRCL